ncbi:MAG: signal peptidase II [Leifsonia sp.]|nr:signal peptidase II [Leifsonia sp.]
MSSMLSVGAHADRREMSGTVIDMTAVDWFAIFNVADIFAVVGIVAWPLCI